MSTKNFDPAFPFGDYDRWIESIKNGMNMRDYFAGQVLAGTVLEVDGHDDQRLARRCYEVSEAMLKERESRS